MDAAVAPPLSAGLRVRIDPATSDGLAQRALLLAADGDADYEVEYEGSGVEAVVPVSRIRRLLPFEEAPAVTASTASTAAAVDAVARAEQRKGEGNALFKLRDPVSALECYVRALRELQLDAPLTVGARCLVKPASGNGAARSAMVMTMDEGTIDLIYDGGGRPAAAGRGRRLDETLQRLLRDADALCAGGGGEGGGGDVARGGGSGGACRSIGGGGGSSACGGGGVAAAADGVASPERWSSWLRGKLGAGGGGGAPASSSSSSAAAKMDGGDEDDDDDDDEEEEGVARDRVALVVHATHAGLQSALLLNAAKCSLMAKARAFPRASNPPLRDACRSLARELPTLSRSPLGSRSPLRSAPPPRSDSPSPDFP